MTTLVNYHRIASDCYSSNACDVRGSLCSCCADTDGVGFPSNPEVSDIDIVIACGKKCTGGEAQCNIVAATCVAVERARTDSCVLGADCIID
jgi:hypothetical protein